MAIDGVFDADLCCVTLGKVVGRGGFGGGPGGAWLGGATVCEILRGREVLSEAGGVRALLELLRKVEV